MVTLSAPSPPSATAGRFARHRGPVTGVEAVPGTDQAVTSAYDGAVARFDLKTGQVELLGYHRHLVNRLIVDPSGRRAASCSSDYTACIWDLEKGRPVRVLRGHSDDVEDFVFADERRGVSASRDHRVLVWDLDTGAILRVLEGHEKDVLSLAYGDGRVYSSGDDKTLRVWDIDSGELLSVWGPFENETDTCAIDPVHGRAVLGCDDGVIRVFDTRTGGLVREIEAHTSGIKKVAVSPATGDILSAAYDRRLVVWDSETFAEKLHLERVPSVWERSLSWSPDGSQVLAGTFDGTVLVWDAASGKLLREVGRVAEEPGNACFNEASASAGGTTALVSDDGYIRLGRLTPQEATWTAKVEPASGRMLMNAVTLDEEYGMVVGGAHDNKVHIYRLDGGGLRDGIEVFLGEGPINTIRIAHHPGHERESFVGCYSSAIVRVSHEGEVRGKIHVHEGAVKALRLHPEKTLGVSCGADGLLLAWSFEGELLESFLGHTAIINDVDLDPRGERLASVSRDFTVKVFQLDNGKLLHSIPLGRRSLKSVCFWDEDTVLVGDYWGSVIRVDLASGKTVRRVIAGNGISSLARSGNHVVATSYDGGAYLIAPGDLSVVQVARAMQQRVDDRMVA
jgi:WD40 repeat protein